MENEWLKDAVAAATGNLPTYQEFEEEVFSAFQKYTDLGYPEMIIVSIMCDVTKWPMTIPAMFDKWRSQQ